MYIQTGTHYTVDLTTGLTAESLSPEAFKAAFRSHPAGVAVVTADAGEGPIAMTVSSLTSISTEPPLALFSASTLSSSTSTLERVESVVIHMTTVEELWLAKLGATSGIDRFADETSWGRLPTGEPYYHRAGRWLRGRVLHRMTVGNSIVHVVQALEASDTPQAAEPGSRTPLVYHNRTWHALTGKSAIVDGPLAPNADDRSSNPMAAP